MDWEKVGKKYEELISSKKQGNRALVHWNAQELEFLSCAIAEIAANFNCSKFFQLFLLLDSSSRPILKFQKNILQIEFSKMSVDEKIIFLSQVEKHCIEASLLEGYPPDSKVFEILRLFLNEKNPEILVWTLKAIESLGPFSLRLKDDIMKLRFPFFSLGSQWILAKELKMNLIAGWSKFDKG